MWIPENRDIPFPLGVGQYARTHGRNELDPLHVYRDYCGDLNCSQPLLPANRAMPVVRVYKSNGYTFYRALPTIIAGAIV